jgi:hypothetical protein
MPFSVHLLCDAEAQDITAIKGKVKHYAIKVYGRVDV